MTEEKTTPLRERLEGWRQSSGPGPCFVIIAFPPGPTRSHGIGDLARRNARARQYRRSCCAAPSGD